jgi:hypothetical protein
MEKRDIPSGEDVVTVSDKAAKLFSGLDPIYFKCIRRSSLFFSFHSYTFVVCFLLSSFFAFKFCLCLCLRNHGIMKLRLMAKRQTGNMKALKWPGLRRRRCNPRQGQCPLTITRQGTFNYSQTEGNFLVPLDEHAARNSRPWDNSGDSMIQTYDFRGRETDESCHHQTL